MSLAHLMQRKKIVTEADGKFEHLVDSVELHLVVRRWDDCAKGHEF